ncbi:hypothetical protein FOZ62_000769, partial [Perkinsus olseni]
ATLSRVEPLRDCLTTCLYFTPKLRSSLIVSEFSGQQVDRWTEHVTAVPVLSVTANGLPVIASVVDSSASSTNKLRFSVIGLTRAIDDTLKSHPDAAVAFPLTLLMQGGKVLSPASSLRLACVHS